ncbi:MAG: hypothetical protein MHM6MM_004599 [Cercozoa sp. M6MM]
METDLSVYEDTYLPEVRDFVQRVISTVNQLRDGCEPKQTTSVAVTSRRPPRHVSVRVSVVCETGAVCLLPGAAPHLALF